MHVANLQLEGLLMALAAMNELLVKKGLIARHEVDTALRRVEAGLKGDERLQADLSPSNRDAVCFPVRLLRLANEDTAAGGSAEALTFADLARRIGQTKPAFNDQL